MDFLSHFVVKYELERLKAIIRFLDSLFWIIVTKNWFLYSNYNYLINL